MKKLISFIAIPVLLGACAGGPHYVINGKISGADSLTFLLQKREAGRYITLDSAVADKGSFKMKGGPVKYPQMVSLSVKNSRMRTQFFLENSEITIAGKLDSLYDARVTGSKTQDEYKRFIDSGKSLSDKYTKIYNDYQNAYQQGDTASVARLEKEADAVQNEITAHQKDFIKSNPKSFITPSLLAGISYDMEAGELESFITGLDTTVANTPLIKDLKDRVTKLKLVAVGQKAPDFTLNDPEGKPVSLSSKIGPKLLLIDFWASWCGPCRKENPNVVKIYNEFHKKGFDVFGVSLDQKRDDWVKAISDDKLTWTHVSDLQFWSNAAAKLYAINSIPSNLLLDGNGMIIGKNLRGSDLYNKVKETLGTGTK